MDIEKVAARQAQVHTRYYLKDGTQVPGVTTALGMLNKPALVAWANNLGLAGIRVSAYVDVLATIGTIGHKLIVCHLKDETPDLAEYPPNLVDKAENCLLKYFAWEKQHTIQPLICEEPLVSEQYRYGGTPDFFGMVDGIPTLIDFKTSKAIYNEHFYQLAAYWHLLEEARGICPQRAMILQIGRDESEGFSYREVTQVNNEWEIFQYCVRLYQLTRKRSA